MNELPIQQLHSHIVAFAVSLPRIGVSLLILPLLSQDLVPPLIRNSVIVMLAMTLFPHAINIQDISNEGIAALTGSALPLLLLKEMLIGLALGFCMSGMFWAMGLAGAIIDTQSGGNMANALDPIQGHQTTLTSVLFSRFACCMFMACGGFLVFVDLLLGSFSLWPVQRPLPEWNDGALSFFTSRFGYIITLALLLSAPTIIVLAVIDAAFGLVNRYAQQLNVSVFSGAIKYWAGLWMTMLTLGAITEIFLREIHLSRYLLPALQQLEWTK